MNKFEFVQTADRMGALEQMAANTSSIALAGGTNLLVNMKRAPLQAETVIDITRVTEYQAIKSGHDFVSLGAGVTFAELLEWCPGGATEALLRPMADLFAGPLIRNLATVGGNICDASPAADISPPLLALDARVRLESATDGQRVLALEAFFRGPRETAILPNELLACVEIPQPSAADETFYYKLGKRKADAISIVSIAIALRCESNVVKHARIALGAVGPVAMCARNAQAELLDRELNETSIRLAAAAAAAEARPIDDFRASAAYRKKMVGVLVSRGLAEIAARI